MNGRPIFFRTRSDGPRLQYVVSELFKRRLGWDIQIDLSDESKPEGTLETGFGDGNSFFPNSGILEENGKKEFQISLHEDFKQSFLKTPDGQKIFGDLPGMAFWLLSRYEEYSSDSDDHGRFPEEKLQNVISGLAEIPLVERWLYQWRSQLTGENWPPLSATKSNLEWSFDLDNLTAYLHKGIWRNTAGLGKDLFQGRIFQALERLKVLSLLTPDPYDNLDAILEQIRIQEKKARFFIWIGDYGPHDKGLLYSHPFFRKKIRKIATECEIGLHPSYRNLNEPEMLKTEKERLENLIERPIEVSRFHFLRYRLPDSYRNLVTNGFSQDWSMGFSGRYGFRAGTGNPFLWYDLEKETCTRLLLVPFLAMDSLSYHKRKETAEPFVKKISGLVSVPDTVSYSSKLVLHNEFPSWEGWQEVLQKLRTVG